IRGRRGDEAADEVVVHWTRADEEAAPDGQPERRLRAGLQRANAFPRTLDAAANGAVEAATAGNLEVREAGPVEDLGDQQLVGCRQATRERVLAEQPDGRIRKSRHVREPSAARL